MCCQIFKMYMARINNSGNYIYLFSVMLHKTSPFVCIWGSVNCDEHSISLQFTAMQNVTALCFHSYIKYWYSVPISTQLSLMYSSRFTNKCQVLKCSFICPVKPVTCLAASGNQHIWLTTTRNMSVRALTSVL